jgi:hypothetical protein
MRIIRCNPCSDLFLQGTAGAANQNEAHLVGPHLNSSTVRQSGVSESFDRDGSQCAFETSVLVLLNLDCNIDCSSLQSVRRPEMPQNRLPGQVQSCLVVCQGKLEVVLPSARTESEGALQSVRADLRHTQFL